MGVTALQSIEIPQGFVALETRPGFLQHCGDFYVHAEQPILAMRIAAIHLNAVGIAHGGLLATLADSAFGVIFRRQLGVPMSPITVSLSIDYIGAVREGDWVEAHVDIHKLGGRLINASCLLKVGERLVLRASGTFTVWRPKSDSPAG